MPVSALHGDNVVERSVHAPWYDGPPLLELLEDIPLELGNGDVGVRLDVQWCIRHPPTDFRGVAGRLSGGSLAVGDAVVIAPSGETTRVRELARRGRPVPSADPGQAITVVFTDHVDVARGDVILGGSGSPARATTDVDADVCWMTDSALVPGARLWFKHGTRRGAATVTRIDHRVDVTTLDRQPADRLELNDLARIELRLSSPIVALPYRQHRQSGQLVLVDPADHATAAAAMITRIG